MYFVYLARRVIAQRWKTMDDPVVMTSCLALEKITFVARGKSNKFRDIWKSL